MHITRTQHDFAPLLKKGEKSQFSNDKFFPPFPLQQENFFPLNFSSF
jgi:hypothetical protein